MIKYYCDKCGIECRAPHLWKVVLQNCQSDKKVGKQFCSDCNKDIQDFIDGVDKSEKYKGLKPTIEDFVKLKVKTALPDGPAAIKLYEAGASRQSIADQFGVDLSIVNSYLAKYREFLRYTSENLETVNTANSVIVEDKDVVAIDVCLLKEKEKEVISYLHLVDADKIETLHKAGWSKKKIIEEFYGQENAVEIVCDFLMEYGYIPKATEAESVEAESDRYDFDEDTDVAPYVDDFVATLRNAKGVTAAMRKQLIIDFCKGKEKRSNIAERIGITVAGANNLFAKYKNYVKVRELSENK